MTGSTGRTAGIVLLLAGGGYALVVGVLEVTFDATPLVVGLAAVLAGLVGRTERLLVVGLPLVGLGAAVLLVRHGSVPDGREAAAFLVGSAVGLLAADAVARSRDLELTGAIVSALVGAGAFYLAYDVDWLGRWPTWAIALAAWGAWETVR